jgi:D-beta-D-heptose 7-phosphate kinase/D-beta-D-heptose 1-phosphate adenosyltransferase
MLRLDTETPASHPESHYTALLAEVFAALSASAVIVLSDYAKGALSYTVCRAIIEEARHLGIPVLVDPKSRSFARYQGATAICPNSRELATATGESAEDTGELLAAGQALLSSLDIPWMGVTLSEKGIAILREDSCVHVPAVARQVYDVSGAGDTVTAVLALALASNIDIDTAAELANIAAGIVVSKVGTVPVQRHELLAALSPEIALCMNEKVLPLDRMLMRVAAWRASGQHVVFTNGCFDLLHAGHISLLEKARRMGDRLIVAINTDSSVRRLKGPQRPVVAENERAQVLAALGAVDAVVIFEQDTPLQLILAIRPDVLVKGGDYSEADVIGAREVRAWGGRVELIPIVEGCSTTRLIEKAFGTRSNQRRLKRAPVNDGSRPADKKELSLAE